MEWCELELSRGGYATADVYKLSLYDWGELSYPLLKNSSGLFPGNQVIYSCCCGKNHKAVRWVGDTMLPFFPHGIILVFDCRGLWRVNDYVLVWDHDEKQALFRRLVEVSDQAQTQHVEVDNYKAVEEYALHGCNKSIPIISKKKQHEIIGVLVATHMNFD